MTATIAIGKETFEVTAGKTIESAVAEIGGYPDTFIFIVNGKPVPMDTPIEDGIVVKAVKVASGG
ncbi:MAG: MoaD/ThiS family protein [Candidatus Methanoplasma sp.]|jgi:sulfur carrier protein|nr:MoaD/ThiS family protein [Candidatus Methanoplasma sp.]